MSIRVTLKTLQNTVATAALLAAVTGLAGCSTLGMGGSADGMTTGSTGYQASSNLNQPMPQALGSSTQVAEGPYLPPEDIGSGDDQRPSFRNSTYASLPSAAAPGSISSQDLPVIGNTSSNGNFPAMSAQPAQQSLPPAYVTPRAAAPVVASTTPAPNLTVVPPGVYTHTIRSGESLYTIARHYGVTAQAIMQASSIPAPDKIFVGQRVVIPGRPDLLAAMDDVKPSAAAAGKLPVDSAKPVLAAVSPEPPMARGHASSTADTRVASLDDFPTATPGAAATAPAVPLAGRVLANGARTTLPQAHNALTGKPSAKPPIAEAAAPLAAAHAAPATATPVRQVATAPQAAPKMPLQEPAMSGADKFRWPVNGKVIIDFANSHGTGINIAAPAGTPVKAAENGTVIYVGSGVEGYGNLILIRHANGYVSAYANLKDMDVAKGATVGRGDVIGSAGATGSVSSPQLHFELRKGATPVDPVPLLAG
jgi:murein DD-endopeptidase MepM/ murein hydrolase activator NlpD